MGDFSVGFRTGGHSVLSATDSLPSRTKLRFGRGISRTGMLRVDVHGLDGGNAPAADDYIEVFYDAANRWSGVIREAIQDRDDTDLWHITAIDPLGLLEGRKIPARVAYSSTDERTVVLDILSRVGVDTTTAPLRITTNSILAGGAGNAIDAHRVEYDDALRALQQLAIAFNREISWKRENIAGTDYWVIYYVTKTTGPVGNEHSVVQQTLTAGQNVETMPDITDSWDKAARVDVLGEGDGSAAPAGTAGAGGATTQRAVVPMRALTSASLAGSAASTLQTAFGSNRRVLLATLEYAEPLIDGLLDVGYLATCVDELGAGLGNYRVLYVEVDEEMTEGWFSRVTLIGSAVPALPSVSRPAGVRPPGLADVALLDGPHKRHKQKSDFAGATQTSAAIFLDDSQVRINASTGNKALAAFGVAVDTDFTTGLVSTDAKAHGYYVEIQFIATAFFDGPVDVEVYLFTDSGEATVGVKVADVTFGPCQAQTQVVRQFFPFALIRQASTGIINKLRIRMANFSPDDAITASCTVSVWKASQHDIDLSHQHNT